MCFFKNFFSKPDYNLFGVVGDNDIHYLLPVSSKNNRKSIKVNTKLSNDIQGVIFKENTNFKGLKKLNDKIAMLNSLALPLVQDKAKNINLELTKFQVDTWIKNLIETTKASLDDDSGLDFEDDFDSPEYFEDLDKNEK